jgi:hypothetical protein
MTSNEKHHGEDIPNCLWAGSGYGGRLVESMRYSTLATSREVEGPAL